MTADPLGVVRVHDGFGGRTDGNRNLVAGQLDAKYERRDHNILTSRSLSPLYRR